MFDLQPGGVTVMWGILYIDVCELRRLDVAQLTSLTSPDTPLSIKSQTAKRQIITGNPIGMCPGNQRMGSVVPCNVLIFCDETFSVASNRVFPKLYKVGNVVTKAYTGKSKINSAKNCLQWGLNPGQVSRSSH